MTEELKPCPFCGGDPSVSTYETESLWSHNQVTYTKVGCDDCDVGFDSEEGMTPAPDAWNARANQPPAQDGLVDALQELLKIGVPRMWKCERGDYCVSIMQKEYFGATLSEAADAALASLGDKS